MCSLPGICIEVFQYVLGLIGIAMFGVEISFCVENVENAIDVFFVLQEEGIATAAPGWIC